MTDDISIKNENWERETLHKLLFGTLTEQRRKRRWKIFFWLLFFGYIFFMTWAWFNKDKTDLYTADPLHREHTARIDIVGEIFDEHGVNAEQIIESLQAAYKAKNCKGIVLKINSPGGSAVQANQIYKEINRLRATRPDLPIYAVIEDMGASAAYWIASAADKIYADEVSLVGSIGVLINSFGFVNAMEKMGIERRLYTAGQHKGMLDPFSPANAEDVAFVKQQLENAHKRFIESVKAGRKGRLANDDSIYSGRFWSGDAAKALGVIDEFGDVNLVARDVFNAPKIIDYTVGSNVFDRLAKRVGAAVGKNLLPRANSIEFGVN
jgi:protease-4